MKKLFITVLLMFCVSSGSTFAAERNVDIDVSEENVRISGNLSDNRAGYLVGLRIKKEGAENYSYIGQQKTGKGGAFDFNFIPNNDNGNFQMYLYLPDEDLTVEKRFAYYSSKVIEEMIEALNSSKTAEEVKGLIIDNGIAFGIPDELLVEYSDKDLLAEIVLNFLKDGERFNDKNEVVEFVEQSLMLDKVNNSEGEEMLLYMDDVVDEYTVSLLLEFSDMSKENIIKRLEEGKKYKHLKAFENQMREAVVLGIIESINGYGDVEKIIKNTTDYTDISLEKFNKLSNKSAVLKSVTGKSYDSFEELKRDFEKLVENATGSKESNKGGGGGSGSGGGYLVPVKLEEDNEKKEEIQDTEKKVEFLDIDSTHWAWEYINKMYQKGVINGKSEKLFDPEGLVTREEFVKMLVIAAGYSIENAESGFSDVSKIAWYYPYVSIAKKNGIINGVTEEVFGVGAPIKRQDMFVIIYRTMLKKEGKSEGLNGQLPFDDAEEVSEYAKKALETMYRMNILSGSNNLCNPNKNATRAEATKVLCEALAE